ncbi:MAG: PilZ domain-containing protein [FCB group bacterium]|jgi:c-di-GMP-binding flagellar brake protein YcgR|nr:PilZ domain-containing protein [FCB group bacterium]
MKPDSLATLLDSATVRTADVTWVLVGVLICLVIAIIAEQFRQKGLRRKRVESEWKTVGQIGRDKALSPPEQEHLRQMVSRWRPDEPLRAVTVRYDFDACVDQEMTALLQKGVKSEYDQAGIELRDIRVHLGLDFIPYGQRIHSTRELGTGQVVTFWPASGGKTPRRAMRVMSLDEAYMHLVPVNLGDDSSLRPKPNDRLRGQAWRDDDARYLFTVVFVREESDPPAWVVQHTSQMNRMQSRDYFRVRFDQTVTVGVMDPPLGGDLSRLPRQPVTARLRGRITSLSAGGFAMVLQQSVPVHMFLRVHLELPETKPMDIDARIVGTTLLGGGRTLIRGNFVQITDEQREHLVRYVTLLQQRPTEQGGLVETRD